MADMTAYINTVKDITLPKGNFRRIWQLLAALLLLMCLLLGPFRVDDGYADTCIPSAAFGSNVWTEFYTKEDCSDRVRTWTRDELSAIACHSPYWSLPNLLVRMPAFTIRSSTGLDALVVLDVVAPERLYPCGAHENGCSVPVLVCTFDRFQLGLQVLQLMLSLTLSLRWFASTIRNRSDPEQS